jgi:signal transduction histidine kinase
MELELLVLNLVKNALEAAAQTSEGEVEVTLASDQNRIRLMVSDNGPAISDRDFARLSEPLSSSKPDGTGLGVAIVRMVAEKHQGSVTFVRRDGRGLEAAVDLPASREED